MNVATLAPDETRALLAGLLGRPILHLERCRPGGNSRVFRVETDHGTVAAKLYAETGEKPNPRFIRETTGLAFLQAQGLGRLVPKVVAADPHYEIAILEWIGGNPVGTPSEHDIDAALALADRLHAAKTGDGAEQLIQGAEACLSADALARQIQDRIARLRQLSDPRLTDFLNNHIDGAMIRSWSTLQDVYAAEGWQTGADIDLDGQTLSPSDFGFHNALRTQTGELVFLDFEYFGWDDPVKMVADFVLHPGMMLSPPQARRFVNGMSAVFDRASFRRRLFAQLPLYQIRWSLICLNEFLPERWQRRVHAGTSENWDVAKARQLAKAASLLDPNATAQILTSDTAHA